MRIVVLGGLLIGLVGACYTPELVDCTISCGAPGECSAGQICNPQGFCAAEGVTCSSDHPAQPDAMQPATPPDAAVQPDASPLPTLVTLQLKVDGKGTVTVSSAGVADQTCGTSNQPHADCTLAVRRGVEQHLVVPPDQFDKWTSVICKDQGATCTVILLGMASVSVKLEH